MNTILNTIDEVESLIRRYAKGQKVAVVERGPNVNFTVGGMEFRVTPKGIYFIFQAAIEGELPDWQDQPEKVLDNFIKVCIEYGRKTPVPVQKEIQMVRKEFGKENKMLKRDNITMLIYPTYSIYLKENRIMLIKDEKAIEDVKFKDEKELKKHLPVLHAIAKQFE